MPNFLKNRWFISVIGLIAIALLIAIIGPLIAIAGWEPLASGTARLLAILLVVLIWLTVQLYRHLKAKQQNQALLKGVSEPAQPTQEDETGRESAEELGVLQKRFDEALSVLKNSRLGGKQRLRYLYQLPWYIIIGPPGSGKTTALVNSGLKFPLSDRFGDRAMQGIGGTRNCDWWFTDDAVLLDTAGRYTTQDSYKAVDQAAWVGFLELLKKYRRRRPINGALVVISIQEIAQQNELERQQHARDIRGRIQELHEKFNIRFPIYVVFSKCDLLVGFAEFFEDLGQAERQQVWGMTFSMPEERGEVEISRFGAEFSALEKRLNQRLCARLEQESDIRRRQMIYAFPQQFSSTRTLVREFLEEVFSPSLLQHVPLLRGVYFTSGTQEGTPIDRLLGTMAEGFGLDRQMAPAFSGKGRSYFLHHLFKKVVFPESQLAGMNLRLERRRAWFQRSAYAGALLLALLAAMAWFTSYSRNLAYVNSVSAATAGLEEQVREVASEDLSVQATLPALDRARNLPGGYSDRDLDPSLFMRLGLYQGEKLGAAGKDAYASLLRSLFLPRVMSRLEEQLRQPDSNPDYLYEALKVYLMLADSKHFDADTIRAWVRLHWQLVHPGPANTALRQTLFGHLDALLEQMPLAAPIPLDATLVDQVRTELVRVPLAQRVYSRLKRTSRQGPAPDFSIATAVGPHADVMFERRSGESLEKPIPGLFTYQGYTRRFLIDHLAIAEQLVGEKWILGDKITDDADHTDLTRISSDVRNMYYQEYIALWDRLLADLRIIRFRNLGQAVEVLNRLSAPDSPLRGLLQSIADETNLDRLSPGVEALSKKGKQRYSGLTGRLAGILQVEQATVRPDKPVRKLNPVTRHFKYLHDALSGVGEGPAPLNRSLAMLNELYLHLSSLDRDSKPDSLAGGDSIAQRMRVESRRHPEPLRGLLASVAESGSNMNQQGMRQHLNAVWKGQVLSFFQRSLADRYPLERRSSQEATLSDFTRFFGPGGLIDNFFNTYLNEFVDTSGRYWRWTRSGKRKLGIPSSTLQQFQRAAVIRDSFFRSNSDLPDIQFDLRAEEMDRTIDRFTLILDGQQLVYEHGPPRWLHFKWPKTRGASEVIIQLSPPAGDKPSTLREEGPWAWLRLIDRSLVQSAGSAELLYITFDVGGRRTRFLMRAASALNPFSLKELGAFRCPNRL